MIVGLPSAGFGGWLPLLVVAAILEEVVFRAGLHEALLRTRLRRLAGWRSPANALTATAFALAHGLNRGWWLAAAALLASLAIGALYERHRRLLPCIALHAGLNLGWLALAPALPVHFPGATA